MLSGGKYICDLAVRPKMKMLVSGLDMIRL